MAVALSRDLIQRAPKVLLHDHLDGGLRPTTVLELARESHYTGLPTNDPKNCANGLLPTRRAVISCATRGFAHTTAVMQTKDHLERVAFEAVLDLARDGVVYAEIRFAPELHLEGGLTLHEVVEAVLEGFTRGMHDAEIEGHAIIVRAILSADATGESE